MKKTVTAFALFIACTGVNIASAANVHHVLKDYPALRAALISGSLVSVVTDFSKCTGTWPTETTGGTRINSFLILTEQKSKNEYISFSDYHQRLKDDDATPQVEFTRYKATADNNVIVDISHYSSAQQKTQSSPVSYTCPINTGIRFYLMQI